MMICPHCQGRQFFVFFERRRSMRLRITCDDTGSYHAEEYTEIAGGDNEWDSLGRCAACHRQVRLTTAIEVWEQAQAEPEPEEETPWPPHAS